MDYPLVLVEWIDACFFNERLWGKEKVQPWTLRSVGWLTVSNPEYIVVAAQMSRDPLDDEMASNYRHCFPREMVKKVTLLETGAQWEWPQEA